MLSICYYHKNSASDACASGEGKFLPNFVRSCCQSKFQKFLESTIKVLRWLNINSQKLKCSKFLVDPSKWLISSTNLFGKAAPVQSSLVLTKLWDHPSPHKLMAGQRIHLGNLESTVRLFFLPGYCTTSPGRYMGEQNGVRQRIPIGPSLPPNLKLFRTFPPGSQGCQRSKKWSKVPKMMFF